MSKINRQHDDETIRTLFKRRRQDDKYYVESVWRSAERTKGFSKDTKLKDYLSHLIKGYGSNDWIPACNRPVRRTLERSFSKAILKKYQHEIKPSGKNLYHVTIVFEEFITGDKNTVIDWPALKKKVATLMRRLGKDFIGMGEIDVVLNKNFMIDGVSQGRVLCPHYHVLFWTKEPIKTRKLAAELSKPFAQSASGMKVVKIERCKDTDVDVRRLSSYLFKAPQGGKTLWMNKEFDSDETLENVNIIQRKSSKKNHRKIVFSRLAEILSHSDIRNLMISGGDGKTLKRNLLRFLAETLNLLGNPGPKKFSYEKTLVFWEIMRSQGVGRKYKVPIVKS